MIPEQFKQNVELDILVFGHPVQANYRYYWLNKPEAGKEPMVSHVEFRSASNVISDTGYRSHFFPTQALNDTFYHDIAELTLAIAEQLARENGYEPPDTGYQMSLF